MFNPYLSREQLEERFSKLQKLNYNQFRWWRMYESPNKPLHSRSPLIDKILNGDYDYSHYKFQAMWCEHELDDLLKECGVDYQKYLEKSSVTRARRKRLLEDFDKDEEQKLHALISEFTKCFRCTREQVIEEMEKCSGTLVDLYYIIEDKYKVMIVPPPRRGRPRKNI